MDNKASDTLTGIDLAVWDGANQVRDARAAWNRNDHGFELPDWVVDYLARTAERMNVYLEDTAEKTLKDLKDVLALSELHNPTFYEAHRDPDVVYSTITTWIHDSAMPKITNPSQGAEHYSATVWNGIRTKQTARDLYDQGRRKQKAASVDMAGRKNRHRDLDGDPDQR